MYLTHDPSIYGDTSLLLTRRSGTLAWVDRESLSH
jgi:hypothetical protein